MHITPKDRTILRDLAQQVAEVASLPVMAQRRDLWKRHNALERVRPMILVFPEGAWRELLPQEDLECEEEGARRIEWQLRSRIYHHTHFNDDTVIEGQWDVAKVIRTTGWGLEPRYIPSTEPTGAWGFDPVVKSAGDLKKLRFPEVRYDEQATLRALEDAQELFGDILEVRQKGISRVSFHLMSIYCRLRGLEQVLIDMLDNPGMLHDAMAFLEQGHHNLVRQYVEMNLLSLNNDGTYHSSGGVGYTDELPLPDYDPDRIRPADIWASSEAQELDPVSPEMHEEFAMQYERRLLAPFGLNGYGCCDDLLRKMDDVFRIPQIRRISICPFADVAACAEVLQGGCIFSWKPDPAYLVGDFDPDRVRTYIQHAVDATQGCVFEMILKDTHTCEHRPERFTQWTAIARKIVEGQ